MAEPCPHVDLAARQDTTSGGLLPLVEVPTWAEIREAWRTIPPPDVDLSLYGDIDPEATYDEDEDR